MPLPLASLFRDRFLTLLANGRGEALDWSAIGGLAARDAGVDLVSGNRVSDQAAPVPSANSRLVTCLSARLAPDCRMMGSGGRGVSTETRAGSLNRTSRMGAVDRSRTRTCWRRNANRGFRELYAILVHHAALK